MKRDLLKVITSVGEGKRKCYRQVLIGE
jgi:hypothetical protein